MSAPDPRLDAVAWDLSDLLVDAGGREPAAGLDAMLADAAARAEAFAEARAGRVAELDGADLIAAMGELAGVRELVGRATSYALLSYSEDTRDPARGALLQRVQERATSITTRLLFFELEWAALDDARADALLEVEGLDFARHHLHSARRYRPHQLSEPEERILGERTLTGRTAWVRLFLEQLSSIEVELDDLPAPVPLDAALSRLLDGERAVRRHAAQRITAALAPGLRVRAFAFNALLADKMVEDRLRRHSHWLASRNLANEASDASVQALIDAVRARYDLPRRWYRLKARLLGLGRLADYDRLATISREAGFVEWDSARHTVLDAYGAFSPELRALAERFFAEHWIDAPVRSGKRGGAMCAPTVPSAHPYVLLNYTSRSRDVLTLAHELGHGLHALLAAGQGMFHVSTPPTMAETASVFGETLVLGRLLESSEAPQTRLGLLGERIDGWIATIFRQVAMHGFEQMAHTERRETGELSVERIGELWWQSQGELLGDSVELSDGYRNWWSYVPHFIGTPGYVYAYAYGQLLALALFRRYEELGESFVPAYLDLLSAGGSRSPAELGRIVGVDLTDPHFWEMGLELVERQLVAAEDAAHVVLAPG